LQTLDLHSLGSELCDYFEALADDRQLRLENQLHGELLADQQLLQRALGNLLANAVRHADEGTPISLRRRDEAGVLVAGTQPRPGDCARTSGQTVRPLLSRRPFTGAAWRFGWAGAGDCAVDHAVAWRAGAGER
jgi:hypothetical protein